MNRSADEPDLDLDLNPDEAEFSPPFSTNQTRPARRNSMMKKINTAKGEQPSKSSAR